MDILNYRYQFQHCEFINYRIFAPTIKQADVREITNN